MSIESTDVAILKTVNKYVKSSIYTKVVDLIYAYIKPMFLEPSSLGLWNLVSVIISISNLSDFGSRTSMRFTIPKLQAEENYEDIQKIKGSVYVGSLIITAVIAISLLLGSYFSKDHITKIGLGATALIVMLYSIYMYYTEMLKSYQIFHPVITNSYLISTCKIVIGVGLLYYFNVYGLFMTVIIVYLIGIIAIKYKCSFDNRGSFNSKIFVNLVKTGFPITLFSYAMLLVGTIDRFLISYKLDLKQLGYYTVAIIVADFVLRIPGSARDVLEPAMVKNLTENNISDCLNRYYIHPLYSAAYLFPFIIISGYFILPLAVPILLSKYVSGIPAAQMILFGAYFVALTFISRVLIVVNQLQIVALVFLLLAIALNAVLSIYFIDMHIGLAGVAAAKGFAYAFLFLCLYTLIAFKYKTTEIRFFLHLVRCILPFVYVVGVIVISQMFSERYFNQNIYHLNMGGGFVALLLYMAFVVAFSKRNRFINVNIMSF